MYFATNTVSRLICMDYETFQARGGKTRFERTEQRKKLFWVTLNIRFTYIIECLIVRFYLNLTLYYNAPYRPIPNIKSENIIF